MTRWPESITSRMKDWGVGAFLVVGLARGRGRRKRSREEAATGETGGHGDDATSRESAIESWLVATDAEREALAASTGVTCPKSGKLPPADLSSIDAIVIRLDADTQPPISDSHI